MGTGRHAELAYAEQLAAEGKHLEAAFEAGRVARQALAAMELILTGAK